MAGERVGPARFSAGTAIVLREAYHKIDAMYRGNHYGLYDYARAVAGKFAHIDTFFVCILQGSNRARYPYGYENGRYDDPATHTYGPNGPTAWLLKHRQTYRFAYDNGAVLQHGVPCGDVTRRSEDVVTVPMFRTVAGGERQIFGLMSMQSYRPKVYDDEAVRAFEWLADVVARVITRETEDRNALRLLPAGDEVPGVLTSDHVMEYLSGKIAVLRNLADKALAEPQAAAEPMRGQLVEMVRTAEQTQSELIEMMLDTDDGPERRFCALTPAQQGVAVLLVQGLDNDAIAKELGVSLHTVKSHIGTVLRKYEMDSRAQVADDVRRYLSR